MPCESIETFFCAIGIMQPSIEQGFGKKHWKRTGRKFSNGMNPYTFSKLKSKMFARELLVQKAIKDAGLVHFERKI